MSCYTCTSKHVAISVATMKPIIYPSGQCPLFRPLHLTPRICLNLYSVLHIKSDDVFVLYSCPHLSPLEHYNESKFWSANGQLTGQLIGHHMEGNN